MQYGVNGAEVLLLHNPTTERGVAHFKALDKKALKCPCFVNTLLLF
jgi:hypothetical protein